MNTYKSISYELCNKKYKIVNLYKLQNQTKRIFHFLTFPSLQRKKIKYFLSFHFFIFPLIFYPSIFSVKSHELSYLFIYYYYYYYHYLWMT